MTMPDSATPADISGGAAASHEAQRRVLTVLVSSQILSGAGLAAGVTVGALLAQDMLGSTDLAGLPSALFTAGSALTAVAVGRISQARGRRPGLTTGYLTGGRRRSCRHVAQRAPRVAGLSAATADAGS